MSAGPREVFEGMSGRHRGKERARRLSRVAVPVTLVLVTLAAGMLTVDTTRAAFSGKTVNSGNKFTAMGTFPSYYTTLRADTPLLYHRQDDAPASTPTTVSTDSSNTGADGLYNGVTNGSSTWWKLDDAAGTAASDGSGAANPGSLSAGATWSTGQSGGGVALSGSAAVTGAGPGVSTNASYTAAAWVNLASTGTDAVALSQDGNRRSGFALRYRSATSSWAFSLAATDSDAATVTEAVSANNSAAANTWVHLLGVYDASAGALRLYVNGTLANSASLPSAWNATGPLVAGRGLSAGSGSAYWPGSVDNVRTYRRPLNGTEITGVAANSGPTGPITLGVPGALFGSERSSTAAAFTGGAGAYVGQSLPAKDNFTSECWFKASGTRGGALLGFSSTTTGTTGTTDRLAYINASGQVSFGVKSAGGPLATITSPGSYNDGAWHHLAFSLGNQGMKLYLDGDLVATNSSVKDAVAYNGYSRIGNMSLTGYPDRPPSDNFVGTIDEASLIQTQLTDARIQAHFDAR